MTLVRRTPDEQRRYIVDQLAAIDMEKIVALVSSATVIKTREFVTLLALWAVAVQMAEDEKGKPDGR